MPATNRGEVWIVDLGMVGKVRPCLVLGVPAGAHDRALVTRVAHTTSVRGSNCEVPVQTRFLASGAFDAQNMLSGPHAKLSLSASWADFRRISWRRSKPVFDAGSRCEGRLPRSYGTHKDPKCKCQFYNGLRRRICGNLK